MGTNLRVIAFVQDLNTFITSELESKLQHNEAKCCHFFCKFRLVTLIKLWNLGINEVKEEKKFYILNRVLFVANLNSDFFKKRFWGMIKWCFYITGCLILLALLKHIFNWLWDMMPEMLRRRLVLSPAWNACSNNVNLSELGLREWTLWWQWYW